MFIYSIKNLENNRIYIGLTKNCKQRKYLHFNQLKRCVHDNPRLQEDFNIYGKSVFTFNIVEECDSSKGKEREDYWIDYFGGIESDTVYNCQNNKNQNKEMIYKQNLKKIGSKRSEKFKQIRRDKFLVNNPMKGKHHSIETKKRLSESHKGIKNSMYGKRGKNSPNYGRKQSQYVKDRCREANLGKRKYSDEFITNLREDYKILGTYIAVANKYNINVTSITNLIKYGTPAKPSYYK